MAAPLGYSIDVEGAAAIDQALSRLGSRAQEIATRDALRRGGKIISDEARRLVPVRTGALRKGIGVSVIKDSRGELLALIGVKGKGNKLGQFYKGDLFYGSFIEFGWKHGARKGRKVGRGRQTAEKAATRKQIPGRFFLRTAFMGKVNQAFITIRTRLEMLVESIWDQS